MRVIVKNIITRVIFTPTDYTILPKADKELIKLLRVRKQGYNRIPSYQKKQWDGWTRLVSKNNEFATGFLYFVIKYFKGKGLSMSIKDDRDNKVELLPQLVTKVGNTEDWDGFDYQVEIVKEIFSTAVEGLPFYRGIIDAATNAGKTTVMALVLNNIIDVKAVILTDRKEIYKGTLQFLKSIYGDRVGEISGKKNEIAKDIVIAMTTTLCNRLDDVNVTRWLHTIKVTILDECHRGASPTALKIASVNNSYVKLYVSGTSMDITDPYKKLLQVGVTGAIFKNRITNSDLIAAGKSVPPKCTIHYSSTGRKFIGGDYKEEYKEVIMYSLERAEIMCNHILENPKSSLIVVQFKEHGEFLLEYFKGLLPGERIEFAHGKDKKKSEKIEAYKKGEFDYLITTSILQEGANIPIIKSVWYMRAGKSKVAVKQFYGRSARIDKDGNNDYVEWHDFFDEGKDVSPHSRKRIRYLLEEGFDVSFDYEHNRWYSPKK
jgi:superfamily II DNA or RNA helicase